jgi:hypothetical protein
MGSVLELDYKHVGRSPQVGWSGLEKLDLEIKLNSGIELDSGIKWKKNLKVKNSKG